MSGRRAGLKWRLVPIAAVVVLALAGASCSSGVSEEEFEAVKKDLQNEVARVLSLESELEGESTDIDALREAANNAEMALIEATDNAEMEQAALVSQIAQERTTVEGLQKKVDEAEVQAAVFAAFRAWNRKDEELFSAGFTENGKSESVLSLPASVGAHTIAVRRVQDTTVSEDTASIHVMYGLGTQRSSVIEHLVKEEGVWKIDSEEQMAPGIKGSTGGVDVQVDGCAVVFDPSAITTGNVALKVANVGSQPFWMTLSRVPEGQGTTQIVGYVNTLASGEQTNLAFTQPLGSGQYQMQCSLSDQDDGGSVVAEFTVP